MAFANYYNAPMMQPNAYGYNNYQAQMQKMQPMPQMQQIPQMEQYAQPQPVYKPMMGLQGKSVDSIDVVKAMDIPLDGSISYFPLTDGSAIISKQLQMDGTSKTIIYEPIKAENEEPAPKYLTSDDLNEQIKVISQDNEALKEGMSSIKEQIADLSDDFKKLIDEVKSLKGGKK